MKTQIVLLSIAVMAIHSPVAVPTPTLTAGVNISTKTDKPQSTDFAFFRTHRQGKGITSVWALNCHGEVPGCFMVQRTYEDPNDPYAFWEDLNYMPATTQRFYKWTDENVFPGYVSYRITAYMFDGTTITSDVSQVRIVRH